MIRQSKTEFLVTVINQNQYTSKKLWGYMDHIAPKETK